MYTSTIICLLGILLARIVGATPPACVLAAVNTQPDPLDLQAVCSGANATEVRQYIHSHCNINVDAALSAFDDVCNNVLSTSATASSQGSASSTGLTTSASPTATGDNIASRVGMDILGMAAIGLFGAMMAL